MANILEWKQYDLCLDLYVYVCLDIYIIDMVFFYFQMVLPKWICKRALFNWLKNKHLWIKYC